MRKALLVPLSLFLWVVLLIGWFGLVPVRVESAVSVTFYPTDDTFTFSAAPTTNYDSETLYDGGYNSGMREIFLAFNEANVSSYFTEVTNCTLYLSVHTPTNPTDLTVHCYRLTQDFVETVVTYNTRPNKYVPSLTTAHAHYSASAQNMSFDLTSFMNDYLDGVFEWFGFNVYGSNMTNYAIVQAHPREVDASTRLVLTGTSYGESHYGGTVWTEVPLLVQFIVLFGVMGLPAMILGMAGAREGWGLQGLLFGALMGLGVGVIGGLIPFWFVFLLSLFIVLFLYSMARKS